MPAASSLLTLLCGLPEPAQLILGPLIPSGGHTILAALSGHWDDAEVLLMGDLAARTATATLWGCYGRSNEAEADYMGYHISEAAGFNPDGGMSRPDTVLS